MAQLSIVEPGAGETVTLRGTRLRILEDGTNTEHRLGLAELVIDPRTEGPAQHWHARHDEGFYVISGTVRFTVGETTHDAPAGTWVMVPPGVPHTFANTTGEPAVLLTTFSPDLYLQYFRDLARLTASGQPVSPQAVAELMAGYATTPVSEAEASRMLTDLLHDSGSGQATEPPNHR